MINVRLMFFALCHWEMLSLNLCWGRCDLFMKPCGKAVALDLCLCMEQGRWLSAGQDLSKGAILISADIVAALWMLQSCTRGIQASGDSSSAWPKQAGVLLPRHVQLCGIFFLLSFSTVGDKKNQSLLAYNKEQAISA